jgi:hypothetical protein
MMAMLDPVFDVPQTRSTRTGNVSFPQFRGFPVGSQDHISNHVPDVFNGTRTGTGTRTPPRTSRSRWSLQMTGHVNLAE